MPNPSHDLMSCLRVIVGAWRNDPRDDAELIARFVETRDQTAFSSLVGRHGTLVWQTCRRLLGDTPDAEDAFQTTFLALSRKAGKFPVKNLAGWLYRVSRQTAMKARSSAQRRQTWNQHLQAVNEPETKNNTGQGELYAALDEELAGLPEKLRVPLLLRYMESKTLEEVARIVGCSRPVVKERLTKGEILLRAKLERRGLTLGVASVATLLGSSTGVPPVPARLIENTAQAAVAFRAGTLPATSARAAEDMLRSLSLRVALGKGWWLVLASVCSFVVFLGAGLIAWRITTSRSDVAEVSSQKPAAKSAQSAAVRHPRVDLYGDSLPEGAISRIGTVDFRVPGTGWYSERDDKWGSDVALSPDGKILVSSHTGGTGDVSSVAIRFWDAVTGKQLHEVLLKGESDRTRLALSSDGKILAATIGSIEHGQEVRLLDVASGQLLDKSFPGEGPIAFVSDSKRLACKNIRTTSFTLYDVDTGKAINSSALNVGKRYRGSTLVSITFSRDGCYFACIEETGTVHLLDVKTGEEVATLKGWQAVKMVFAPDGNLITAGKDKVIRVWDTKTGKELRQLATMQEVPSLIGFLADGKTIVAACTRQICFRDVSTGQEMRPTLTCKDLLCPLLLSADGTKLIERFQDALSIWDVATGKEIGPAAGASRSLMYRIAFSPDGRNLATIGFVIKKETELKKTEIQLWEVATGKPIGSLMTPLSASYCWEVIWPLSHKLLARMTSRAGPMIVQLATEAAGRSVVERQTYPDGAKFSPYPDSATFSPDGQVLAHQRGQILELLEIASRKKFSAIPWEVKIGATFAFSKDHQLLATHSADESMITLWDVSTGRKLYDFNLIDRSGFSRSDDRKYDNLIGFSPDNRLVVTQNVQTKVVRLWEHVSGQERLRLPPPPEFVRAENNVAFSRDGRLLAIGYVTGSKRERSIRVWDLATGQECQRFQGHKAGGCAEAPQVVFSPDGRLLASAGMDYTVLIWDVRPPLLEKLSQPLSPKEMQALKTDLDETDAAAAYRAICKLRQVPDQAVPLATECLQLPSDSKGIAREASRLISDLDSDHFSTRQEAARELRRKLGQEGGSIVQDMLARALLDGKLSFEVNNAVTKLLDESELKWGGAKSPELTRMFRGIEVLELIHTEAACAILQKMVETPPRPEVRREAEAALKRLAALSLAPARSQESQ